jgi:hypothetical protein
MATASYEPNGSSEAPSGDGFGAFARAIFPNGMRPGAKGASEDLTAFIAKLNGSADPVAASTPPEPTAMAQGNNRVTERLVNAGVNLDDFKALSQADQQTLLQQLAAEEQTAMIQGFDVAKQGYDVAR